MSLIIAKRGGFLIDFLPVSFNIALVDSHEQISLRYAVNRGSPQRYELISATMPTIAATVCGPRASLILSTRACIG